ncbi:MAG TPA: hypothetical protein VEG44_09825 [Candidatus Acidoferrales bacterium]|nr:hypothetical protein [Candidatus Acidoferrales bacterium]
MLILLPGGGILGLILAGVAFAFPSVINSLLSPFGLSLNTQIPWVIALPLLF